MTKEGKAYLSIIGVIFVVATVWTLWKVFLGVALIVLAIGLLVGACYVWRYVHALMLADREDVAQVERQEAAAERARADAALRWVEVEAARARVDLIPAGYDGVRLKRPEEAVLRT
jgi:type VI protein secretion system component VasK